MKKVLLVFVLMLVGVVFNSCADPIGEMIDNEQTLNKDEVGPTPAPDTTELDLAGI